MAKLAIVACGLLISFAWLNDSRSGVPSNQNYLSASDELAEPVTSATKVTDDRKMRTENEPFAIVELFTSEGCSSCPPADINLKRISETEPARQGRVITLSYHVDYWNRLGWKDPFSDQAFSLRQSAYAEVLDQSNLVYTPQMIVNGRYGFNGSDRVRSDNAIEFSLNQSVGHVVTLKRSDIAMPQNSTTEKEPRSSPPAKSVQLGIDIQPASNETANDIAGEDDLVMNVVVARDVETVEVKRGENGGQTLSHVWVVRSLITKPLVTGESNVELNPKQIVAGHSRAVVFVQSKTTGVISGAAAIEL